MLVMEKSKAEEIPEELFEGMLWYASGSTYKLDREGRGYVSACASVCSQFFSTARQRKSSRDETDKEGHVDDICRLRNYEESFYAKVI